MGTENNDLNFFERLRGEVEAEERHTIDLDATTYHRVVTASRALNVTPSRVISLLVASDYAQQPVPQPAAQQTPPPAPRTDWIPVFAIYRNHRVTGAFDPVTQAMTIPEGFAQGSYKLPGGARVAVIRALAPEVNPAGNGWLFWRLESNGKLLQSIRRPVVAAPYSQPPTPQPEVQPEWIPVFGIYRNHRVTGSFEAVTQAMTIPEGAGQGSYKQPGAARAAVVRALAPEVHPGGNGWFFWRLERTGEPLQSIRRPTDGAAAEEQRDEAE